MTATELRRLPVAGHKRSRTGPILERERGQEFSVQTCLGDLGISSLVEWDVFAFVYRHGTSLTSADQIARLLGHESALVSGALDRLQTSQLIERSRLSQGVHLYRIKASMDLGRQQSVQYLIGLTETRSGRLFLTRQLKLLRPESRAEKHSAGLQVTEGDYA